MTLQELAHKVMLRPLTPPNHLQREVSGAYVSDVLNRVLRQGRSGMIWVTVRTHLSVIAVAEICDCAGVVFPEGISVPAATVQRARLEQIPLFGYDRSAYELCAAMNACGIHA